MTPDRIPVLVGAGEIVHRPAEPGLAREPADLMAEALRRADADAGAKAGSNLLASLDSLDIVNSVSWPYHDVPAALVAHLGQRPARLVYGPVGGESPVRYIHEAANRIARGESQVSAVVGGESTHAVAAAQKAGITLPWTTPDPNWSRTRGRDFLHPLAVRLGVADPVTVYPFYENAIEAHWGQTPAEGQAESAALWSAFSEVAARNPAAWLGRATSAAEIATPSGRNRPIAFPYNKLMVANPMVNQGAAILLTSLARAREVGIAEDRLVYLWAGAAAVEPRDYLNRDHYHGAHAQNAVLDACAGFAAAEEAAFETCELYSCFPCVPKMAARRLGLAAGAVPTTTGGLTFFGAPLNNYMTHAAAAMIRALRARPGTAALLYGQGEFVTKHHAVVLASRPPREHRLPQDYSVQAEADGRRGPVPEFVEAATGEATIETHTVLHDRDGQPHHGVVILRTADGRRTLARVPATDAATIALLKRPDRTPIGTTGPLRTAADGVLEWQAA
ncbi:acetyl-CoA acetyltransferase [Paeniroseomonas aquatica]|uniref:Acetyl-CoA acetyltransferase n=1 Tax=Paeniroseomonas aquatica TaxID=373043 RepID=A0ABT8AHB4_9PROT|nr:acetyl-CoA acetyltransferase [Paeniroseomonas aquatica]MDN3568946.1 acetyl-CoA acetyltransferase [Paeniroseomonas aquatica]